MKPSLSYKMDGTKLLISGEVGGGVDKDQDGVESVKASIVLNLEANGLEIMDELMKSNEVLGKIKEKLGLS